MGTTNIVAKIMQGVPVIACPSCGEYFSVVDWPQATNGEPEEKPVSSVKCCPLCGAAMDSPNPLEKQLREEVSRVWRKG